MMLRRRVPHPRSLLMLLVLVSMGCTSPTTLPETLAEQWRYVGTQRLPSVLQLEGTLQISRGSGARFEGALDLLQTDVVGQVERVSGLVAGRRDGAQMDFEVVLNGAIVRHVGRMTADSITGTWIDAGANGGTLVSGAFVLHRSR